MAFVDTKSVYEQVRLQPNYGIFGSIIFAIFTGLSTLLVIQPKFTPVPITAQTLVVLLSGIFLGKRYGSLSQLLYIGLGVVGIPWFAGRRGGIEVILGTTGGYLIGFIMASYWIGYVVDSSAGNRRPEVVIHGLTVSTLLIYVTGISILMVVTNVDLNTALNLGFFPFLPGDLLKLLIATLVGIVYLPRDETKVDASHSDYTLKIILTLSLIATTVIISFIIFILQAGTVPPEHLQPYSIFASLAILPALILSYRKLREIKTS